MTNIIRRSLLLGSTLACGLAADVAHAQTAVDRVDPSRIERENLPQPARPAAEPKPTIAPAPQPAAPATASVTVGAIVIDGLQGLAPGDFADILARYVGRTLAPGEVSALTDAVAARARGRGYVFASVGVEPQRLMAGVLRLTYDPGRIEDIRLEGDDIPAVRAALAPLVGRPARLDEVERRLLIAGDIDGVSVRDARFVREDGRGLLIATARRTRLQIRAVAENDSTAPIGPEQLRLDADISAVFGSDDAFTVTYVTTPFEPEELQFVRTRYAARINAQGTELSVAVAASSTRPGAYLDPLDITGRSRSLTVGVLHPLVRQRGGSLWLRGGLEVRDSEQQRRDILYRQDRVTAMRVSLYGNRKAAGGLLRGSVMLSQGLDLFGATRAGDPLASRRDADGTFTSLLASADWTRPLGEGWSMRLAAQGQVASDPLLVAEEIGLGGTGFLRGYDYSERSGDNGYMGFAEVRYDWRNPLGLGRRAQLYGFVDGGRVTNLSGGFGSGSLASGGAGIRADVSRTIDANVELAVPLTGPRYETGGADPRLNLRVMKLF